MDVENPKTEKPQLIPLRLSAVDGSNHYDIIQETLIGREVECAISLDSAHVSRYHAKIVISDNGPTIEDLNSSNGTYVNGKRIAEKTRISVGDELRFDNLTFRLTSSEAGNSDTTVMISRSEITNARKTAIEPSSPPPVEIADTPAASMPDEDNTRMLSSEQINQIATINKHFQKFLDTGSGPRLIATTAPIRGKVFPLVPSEPDYQWILGRSQEADICVSDPSVSRNHAYITKNDGRFHIHSMNTSKAILINDINQSSAILKHNDQLQVGHVEFIFRLDEQDTKAVPIIPETPPNNHMLSITIIATVVAVAVIVMLFIAVNQ